MCVSHVLVCFSHLPHVLGTHTCVMQGVRLKGSRAWRRNLAATPLAATMASGDVGAIPGTVVALSRLGGWQLGGSSHSTMLEIYTPQTADLAATTMVYPCGGRQPAVQRIKDVRVAVLQTMASAVVDGKAVPEDRPIGELALVPL
jgi:hypothetical protein